MLAGVLSLCITGCAAASSLPPAAAPQHPVAAATVSAKAHSGALVGQASHYRLFIHCGIPLVAFAHREWRPVKPFPRYYPSQDNGGVTVNGYVAGTLRLISADVLKFTADATAVAKPYAVTYVPTKPPAGVQPACA
ncbi:MAG: hypothetical protein JWM19_6862 [Actinomycetia bacterium]|nr:hypothetical protein [Actinomycetes bacterium]